MTKYVNYMQSIKVKIKNSYVTNNPLSMLCELKFFEFFYETHFMCDLLPKKISEKFLK